MVEDPQSDSPEELERLANQVVQEFLASKPCGEGTGIPEEAGVSTVEEDLQLSSDSESSSAMSDTGESTPEPLPRDPPTGDDWFDCDGRKPEPTLKRSASGEVPDGGVQPGTPAPSQRFKKYKPQSVVSPCKESNV